MTNPPNRWHPEAQKSSALQRPRRGVAAGRVTAFLRTFPAKPEQLCRAAAGLLSHGTSRLDDAGPLDITPEILLVQAWAEDRFRRPLQVKQREHRRHQVDRDGPHPET